MGVVKLLYLLVPCIEKLQLGSHMVSQVYLVNLQTVYCNSILRFWLSSDVLRRLLSSPIRMVGEMEYVLSIFHSNSSTSPFPLLSRISPYKYEEISYGFPALACELADFVLLLVLNLGVLVE